MALTPKTRLAVLVSGKGRGTNLQAILDACAEDRIAAEVVLVVGTRSKAPAMERARVAGVPAVEVVSPQGMGSQEAADGRILQLLRDNRVDLVVLAGFMRLLGPQVLEAYRWRVMNTHPALLPSFGGPGFYGHYVHEAVLEAGAKVSGCTVHFINEEYDRGPIILQTPVSVEEDDTPETLAARILPQEHASYLRAIQLFAEGRLRVVDGKRVRVLPPSP
ncbi:MAG TPA: phosphoribosylglycinamide formyltransferase [Armatimonadota bacterium]|jgi:formyltetrahydrofolate-dependent phosphoribosylglycinamide formyltransferase